MIHISAIKKKLIYVLFTVVLIAFTGAGGENSFIEYLITQFEKYNQNHRIENTFLMTDRFVYRPGDDLWFKGYVVSGKPGSNSEDFFIRLVSDRGEEIVYRRYPLSGNETSGRIVIPRSCIPGKYWLIAYTGWMKNRCPQEAFRKEILVSRYFERRFQVETIFDKLKYNAGDTLNAYIRITDPTGRPVAETPFDFVVETLHKSDIKGSGKTDVKGKSKINFIVPETQDLMMLTFEIRSRRLSGDYSVIIPAYSGELSVKFYPEGGSMVAGIPCVMAVSTSDKYGIPCVIKGSITDRSGKILARVHTASDGKGKFEFIPSKDSLFLQVVSSPDRIESYPLPLAKSSGMVVRYMNDSDEDSLRFMILSNYPAPQKTYWIGVLNRNIVWTSTETFTGDKSVVIPANQLPDGILQLTVFDENYNIIANRSVKIKNPPEDLHVQMDRQQFRNRQRVSILVEYSDKLKGKDLALSVSLGNLAFHSNNVSFEDVFVVNSCAAEQVDNIWKNGDMDMLTMDFYPIDWKEILTYAGIKSRYSNKDGLNGTVYDKKENIAPHAKVRITHFPNFRLYETQSDEEGTFRVLFGSDIIDYRLLNIDAYDAQGKTALSPRIDYTYVAELQKAITESLEDSEKERASNLYKYGEPDLIYDLRYGPGRFRKSRTDSRKKYDPYQYANYTDIMDIIQDIQPYRLYNNRIVFTERNRSDSALMPEAIIVVNGALKGTNVEALKDILPSDITNINISNALLDIRKYTPLKFGSVIEITTIQGMSRYSQSQPHLLTGQGILNSEKEFYSPDYSVESSYSADNRKTLYWNPKISLKQGNSIIVTFYTSDIKGTFYGHITLTDNDGNPVEKVFNFQVE